MQATTKITPLLLATLLLVSLTLCQGCNLIRKNAEQELPDTFTTNAAPQPANKSDHSERELCIETAQSVAAKGHAKEAILLYEKAERLDPNGQPLDLELAPLYAAVGNKQSAINRYRSSLARDGKNADAFNNLAWTLMESGQLDEALIVVQQGLAVAPNNKRLLATQGMALHKQGDRDSALKSFRSAYGAAAAHHNLAILDLEQGNTELALEQAELATRQDDCPPECIAFRNSLRENLASIQTGVLIR